MKIYFQIALWLLSIISNSVFSATTIGQLPKNNSTTTFSNKVLDPIITLSPSSLAQFTACLGNVSQTQSFVVSGSGLTNDITISAPTGYEISKDGGVTWQTNTTLFENSGTVATTTLLIRISASTSAGLINGTLVINSGTGIGSINESIQIQGCVINSNSIDSGSISGNQTICDGGNPTAFNSVDNGDDGLPNTFNSSVTYLWQSSTNTTTWTTIPGANNATYNPPNGLTQTTYYRRILVVQVGNNFPCQSEPTTSVIVTVLSNLLVNAGIDVFVCEGNPINLSATVTGNNSQPTTFLWSGPNGFSSSSQSPNVDNSATVSMSGNYTVTATVGDCQVQDVVNVTVVEPQIISSQFVGNQLVKCLANNVTTGNIGFSLLIPSYSNQITSYTINWGDAATNFQYDSTNWSGLLVHTYSTGSYLLSVTMNLANGCSVTKQYPVFVGSSPSPATLSIYNDQANGCVPHTTQWYFTIPNTNVNGTSYVCTWGDSTGFTYVQGNPIPSGWVLTSTSATSATYTITKVYTTSSCGKNVILNGITYTNVYQPTVVTQNPCSTTPQPSGTGIVSVGKAPNASFTPTPNPMPNICVGQLLQLQNTSDFGLTIPNANGSSCLVASPFYWTISPSLPGSWTATGLGSNNGYPNDQDLWTPGLTNPTITFNQVGTYTITLIIKNSCGESSLSKTICVQDKVTPLFTLSTPTSGCVPFQVAADSSATNTLISCSSITYLWTISYASNYCGTSSSFQYISGSSGSPNPVFQFNNAGVYTISLKTTNQCGSLTSATQTIIVKQPPAVSINTISNYCETASISPTAVINSCSNIATGNLSYLWSFPGGTPSSSTALNPTNIQYATPGTYTVSLEVTNECGTTQATNKVVTIFPFSVGGTATANQTICQGSTPAPLLLSGNTGTIQWQYSSTGVAPWTSIAGATGATLTSLQMGALTATRYYQAVVTNGACPSVVSNMITITVNPTSVGGSASSNQTICSGATPTALTLAGTTGTIQWQSSTTGTSGWTNIVGETNSTLVLGALTSTLYYQAIVTSGVCPSATSTKVTLTVSQPSVGGTATANQTICQGSTPAPLLLSGNTGTIQWQYSSTGAAPWTSIAGATGATLTSLQMGALTATRYYQAVVTNGACPSVVSNMITITVNPTSVGGSASSNQTICSGATPTALTLAGTTGTIQWQSSTTGTSGWTNIVGETNSTLVLGALTSTLYYQAIVTSGVCPSATSTKVTLTVSQLSVGGTATANQTICQGSTPAPLLLSGNTGTIQWQYSSTGAAPWTSIAGATGATLTSLQMGALTATRYYQAVVTNGACPSVVSNMITITVNPTSVGGSASSNQTICSGATPTALTLAGTTGTIQWQSSTTGTSGWTNIVGETNSTLVLGALTSTLYYQAIVTSGVCPSATSTKVKITVNPLPIITGTVAICVGITSQLTGSTTAATANPWESSAPLVASVSATGVVTGLSEGTTIITYTNINGCQKTATITVNPLPSISGSLVICKGSTSQLIGSDTAAASTPWTSSAPLVASVTNLGLVSGVSAGTATITYTNSNGCITTALVTVNPLGQVNAIPNQNLCDGGIVNVSFTTNTVTGSTSYDWTSSPTPYIGLSPTGSGVISFTASNIGSGVATSTVTVMPTYTNGGIGCPGPTSQFTISVYPPPTISVHPTPTQDICVEGTVPAFNVAYINGYGTPDYQWFYNTSPTTVGATVISGAINPTYTPPSFLLPGTYYYFAKVCLNGLGCGCEYSNFAVVNVYGDPNASITPLTQTICQNTPPTPIEVTPSAGIPSGTYTYQWYSNVAPNTIGGSPLIPAVLTSTFVPPTNSVGTKYYYCIVSNGLNCDYTTEVVQVVTVAAPIAHLQPTPTQTVCLDGAPTSLTVDFINGTGTPTYQWYSNTVNDTTSGTAISGATGLTYVPPTSVLGTVYYYCIATYNSGGCTTAISTTATVIVNPIHIISPQPIVSQDICVGGVIAPLTVGYLQGVGTATYQWYSNTTNSSTGGTLISAANSSSYTPPTLNTPGDYYYYAQVTLSGSGCGSVASDASLVHVVQDPTVAITPLTQTICQGTTPTDLVVTPTGGVGAYSYQWYRSPSNAMLAGATSATYTPVTTAIGTQSYYCIITQTGLGCSVTSATVSVQVVAAPSVSTQPTPTQTVCLDGAPTSLTVDFINGTGTPTYQWYSNTVNDTTSGTAISAATGLTYVPPTSVLGTVYYYCVATYNSGGCTTAISTTATVIVNPIHIISPQPIVSQDICVGGVIAPLTVGYLQGVGTATYQWYSNTTNSSTGGTLISAANSSSYTPPTLNTPGDYYYYAQVTLSGSGCGSVASDASLVHVVQDPTVAITPLTQTICQGTTPTDLVVTPTGGVGAYSYQWYRSPSNAMLAGATSATYTPVTTAIGTQSYYCIITQTGLGCSVTSATVSVQVVAAPSVSTQPTPTQTVCLDGAPTSLTVDFINGTGTPTYQWYSNTVNDTTSGTAISAATGLTYVPPTSVLGTVYYYCVATYNSGGCTTAISTTATVIVNPIHIISPQPIVSQDICVEGVIAPLTVGYLQGVGTATYQWYSNTTNSSTGGTLISAANSSSYTPPTLNTPGDYYYYAQVTLSGSGCGSVASDASLVHVVQDPTVAITPLTQTICQGTTPTDLVVTPTGGVGAYSYQWYRNTINSNSSGTLILGATNASYTPVNSVVGIQYYYCEIIQTGLNCQVVSEAVKVITVASPSIATQPLNSQVVCQNDVTTNLSVVAINGAGTPQYQWYTNSIDATIGGTPIFGATSATYSPSSTILGIRYYYCTIQYDEGGCGNLITNTCQVESIPIAFIQDKAQTICSGEAFNVPLNGLNLPEFVPPGTQYIWYVTDTAGVVTGDSDQLLIPQSGVSQTLNNFGNLPYTLIYHVTPLSGNCEGAEFTISITVNPKVKPNELITTILCNSNPPLCDGSIVLSPTGLGSSFVYEWNIPGTSTSQLNLCSGNYWVEITDAAGCEYHFDYTVSVPLPMVAIPTVNPINNTNCDVPSTCNGIIQVAVSGGTPLASATNPYLFQWYEIVGGFNIPINNSLTQINTSILQNLCGGTYYLVVTDALNCQKQFGPYLITDPSPLVVTSVMSDYNGYQVSCNGGTNGTISVNVTGGIAGGITITLNPGGIIQTNPATFTGLTAGSYTVVIDDVLQSCPNITRNFVVTEPSTQMQATITTVVPALCSGDQAVYQVVPTGGVGGYTYLWSNGSTTALVSSLPVGPFSCTVTDSNGCQKVVTGVNAAPTLLVATAVITTPIACFGGTATLSVAATGGSGTYSGAIGIHTGVLAGNSPIYTVSDSNGCQATVSIPVAQPPVIQVTAVVTTPILCAGGTASVTVTASGGTGIFNSGTGIITGLSAGLHTFTVTDSNGCQNSATLTIPNSTPLLAVASITSPILCNSGVGTVTISGFGGTLPYTGTGPISASAGNNTYVISDANGCNAAVTITVPEPTPLVVTATIVTPILCKGGNATISIMANGGVSGYSGTGSFVVSVGIQTFTVTDANNCTKTIQFAVNEPTELVATAVVSSPILCNGQTGVVTISASGGTLPYTGIGNFIVASGTHNFTVVDANNCSKTVTITVGQPQPLSFAITSVVNPNCSPDRSYSNGSICITVLGGTNPFPIGSGWSNTGTNKWCLTNLSAGSFTLLVTDINGCTSPGQVITLTRPPALIGNVTSNNSIDCDAKTVTQINYAFANGGTPPYYYSWSAGQNCTPVSSQCMQTTSNGNYFAYINDAEGIANGCPSVPIAFTVANPTIGQPLFTMSSANSSYCGLFTFNDPVTLTNTSTGDYTQLEWYINGQYVGNGENNVHTFTSEGTYTIQLKVTYSIDGVDCVDILSQEIEITKGYELVTPTAFTPNNDGINDTIRPVYNCMTNVTMSIYDTWGSLLYTETGATLLGWDGTIDGKEAENGNYIIVVTAIAFSGKVIDTNGPITLLK